MDTQKKDPGFNFINILKKKTVKSSSFIALLGSASVKAACRILVKLTPDFSLEEEKVVSLLVRSPSDRFLDGLFMLDGRTAGHDCPVISDRTLPISELKTDGSPVNEESGV